LLEQLDRLRPPLGPEGDLTEPRERSRPGGIAGLKMCAVQTLGLVDLTKPKCDFRVDQLRRLDRCCLDTGREPLTRDVEAKCELIDHLERGDAGACFEARDVRRGAAGEGELALREPGAFA
jgi:hypothetical protein